MRKKGKIASWDDDKAYGFISPRSGGKRLFVHINAFSRRDRRPELGQTVSYRIATDKQGRPCAANAKLSGGSLPYLTRRPRGTLSLIMAIAFLGIVGLAVIGGYLPPMVFALYLALSLLTYVAYAIDKSAAKRGAWRTQESTLHLLSLAGGWPGALTAQQRLRHKSRKNSFRFLFWITVILNIGGLIGLFTTTRPELLNSLLQGFSMG
jgi:uncharacterized membrane protein YsdA (DUF1294 family)/cold shock CspA family protein